MKKHSFEQLYKFRCWQALLFYSLFYFVFSFLLNHYILTNDIFYAAFSSRYETGRIQDMIALTRRMQGYGYAFLPAILVLKWTLIAGAIYSVIYIREEGISFSSCLKIVAIAELPVLLSLLVKVIYFMISPPADMTVLQHFYPGSLMQLFNPRFVPIYFQYPLQYISLFEMAYWTLLMTGIWSLLKKSKRQSLQIAALSYGSLTVIWLLCIVFINLQLS